MIFANSTIDAPVPEDNYRLLMEHNAGFHNDHYLASMLGAWLDGESVFPATMGLGENALVTLLTRHFPEFTIPLNPQSPSPNIEQRLDEKDDIKNLLLANRANLDESEHWIADLIATGCMGSNHLWQDLGLRSRKDLSEMLNSNFPALAQKNDRNMKWKKFLYKQLCNKEGIYVCRSPSCEVCADYAVCFGPEE